MKTADLLAQLDVLIRETLLPPLAWQQLERVVDRWLERHRRPMHQLTDLLPCLGCVAAGGQAEKALPAAAFWIFYFFAAKLFDNVQDDENHHLLWMQDGTADAISYGLGLISVGNQALSHLEDSAAMGAIGQAFGRTWALAAKSQTESQSVLAYDAYFANIIASTAQPFSTAVWSGAKMANADENICKQAADYGLWAGLYQSVRSDCRGLAVDVARGVYKLPVVLACEQQAHPRYAELRDLLADTESVESNAPRLLALLGEMQAVEQALAASSIYRDKALAALEGLPGDSSLLHRYVS